MTALTNTSVKDLRKSVSTYKKKNHPAHSKASRASLKQYIPRHKVPVTVTKPMRAKKKSFASMTAAEKNASFQKATGKAKKKTKKRVQLQQVPAGFGKVNPAFAIKKQSVASTKVGDNQRIRVNQAISSIQNKIASGAYSDTPSFLRRNLRKGKGKKSKRIYIND